MSLRVIHLAKAFILSSALLALGTTDALGSSPFDSDDPQKAPQSVPLSGLTERINSDPFSSGIKIRTTTSDGILRVDMLSIPGDTSLAAVVRVVFMIGRLAEAGFDELRFCDGDTDVFVIDGDIVRNIGREFVWGEEGKGQNPIHLMRAFADGLRYPDGSRVAPEMSGALLGDSTIAAGTLTEVFHSKWTVPNTTIE